MPFCCVLPLLLLISADLRMTLAHPRATSDPTGVSETALVHKRTVHKRAVHLCGSDLVETLWMVCHYRFRRNALDSTSLDSLLQLPTSDDTSSADITSLRWRLLQTLFTPHSQERRLMASGVGLRAKRDIVETCCYNGCDLDTLQMYC